MIKASCLLLFLAATGCTTVSDPRPNAWCGWQMRQEVPVDPGKKFNRAQAWKEYGTPAPGPEIGAIVVWSRRGGRGHVGRITGYDATAGQWVVRSGNDGHELRERPRSVAGAVFRR